MLLPQSNLASRSVGAFLWGSGGAAIRLILQIGTQVVLARLLGPEQYGLFAIGVIVISFSAFFSDVGFAYGLIQRRHVTNEHIRYVFTQQVAIGVIVALAVATLSGPLAVFFNEPRAQAILLALAPLCVVQAIAAVSLNLLKRNLNVKALQIAQTASYILGYLGVGIPLAMVGWQVWALISAWAVQAVSGCLFLYLTVRHSVRPLFRHKDGGNMSRFGVTVFATNLINWLIGNIDRIVVARVLSSTAVGHYSTAYNLMQTPSTTLMGVVQPIMYAACAKVEGETTRIRNAYLVLLSAIGLGTIPFFVAVSAVAETVVAALYGPAWSSAAEILRPIALAMPFYLIWNIATPTLWIRGQTTREFMLQVPLAFFWLVGSVVAAHHSLVVLGWTVFGLFFLRATVFAVAVARDIYVTAAEFWRSLWPGLLLSAFVGTTARVADVGLAHAGLAQPQGRLLCVIILSGGVAVVVLRMIPTLINDRLAQLIEHGRERLPVCIGDLMFARLLAARKS